MTRDEREQRKMADLRGPKGQKMALVRRWGEGRLAFWRGFVFWGYLERRPRGWYDFTPSRAAWELGSRGCSCTNALRAARAGMMTGAELAAAVAEGRM